MITEDQEKRMEKILDKTSRDLIAVLEEKEGYVVTEMTIPIHFNLKVREEKENEDAEK